MHECADRAADAPLTLLRREHAGIPLSHSPALTCTHLRSIPTSPPPPTPHLPPLPPPSSTSARPTSLSFAGQLGGRRARQAGDRRVGRGRGVTAGAAARCNQGEVGEVGRVVGGAKPRPSTAARLPGARVAHPAMHRATRRPPPRQVLPHADMDAVAQITRCLANLLLDDACRSRVVAHEGGLRLLLQQARHRWVAVGGGGGGGRGGRPWGPRASPYA